MVHPWIGNNSAIFLQLFEHRSSNQKGIALSDLHRGTIIVYEIVPLLIHLASRACMNFHAYSDCIGTFAKIEREAAWTTLDGIEEILPSRIKLSYEKTAGARDVLR